MNYFGASINTASMIAETAGVEIKNGAFKAVKYDANGNVVLCTTEGELVAGILLPETTVTVSSGEDVTIQIKDIGLGVAGGAIEKGAELMVDTTGKLITATTGKFIVGYAMEKVGEVDTAFSVDVRKSGYKA